MKKLGTLKAVRNFFAGPPKRGNVEPALDLDFREPEDGGNRRGEIGEFKEEQCGCRLKQRLM